MHPLLECTCYGYPSKLMLTSVRKILIYELVVGRLSGTYIAVTQSYS